MIDVDLFAGPGEMPHHPLGRGRRGHKVRLVMPEGDLSMKWGEIQ